MERNAALQDIWKRSQDILSDFTTDSDRRAKSLAERIDSLYSDLITQEEKVRRLLAEWQNRLRDCRDSSVFPSPMSSDDEIRLSQLEICTKELGELFYDNGS